MKPPVEPKAWKYPRLYMRISKDGMMQPSEHETSCLSDAVIIYPMKNEMGWFTTKTYTYGEFDCPQTEACWEYENEINSPQQARNKLFTHNETSGDDEFETIFLGEIK